MATIKNVRGPVETANRSQSYVVGLSPNHSYFTGTKILPVQKC